MKLKILVPLAGHDFAHGPGDIADVEPAEARRWIAAGFAEAAVAEAAVADLADVETATKRRRGRSAPKAK